MSKRKTYEEIKQIIEVESKSGCLLLTTEEEYYNILNLRKTKLKLKCKCGETFDKLWYLFNNKNKPQRQCKKCGNINSRLKQKLSYTTVKNYIEVESNSDCILLSKKYINNLHKLKLICKCGNIFEKSYASFKKSPWCKYCGNKKSQDSHKLNYFDIKMYIENNSNCQILSNKYERNSKNLKLRCECGKTFERSYASCDSIIQKNKILSCNDCKNIKLRNDRQFTLSYVIQYIKNKSNCQIQYDIIYDNQDSKIYLKCECGELFETTFNKFKNRNKRQCNSCGIKMQIKSQTLSYKYVSNFFMERNFNLINKKYINCRQKLDVQCPHGHIFSICYGKFQNGRRCPICNMSSGEQIIYNWLILHGYNYKYNYTFDDCIYINKLRFDFAILNDNKELIYLIEYDGQQHFEPVRFNGISQEIADLIFEKNIIRDDIKNQYCKDNNIELIRIPYWDLKNIEHILNNTIV